LVVVARLAHHGEAEVEGLELCEGQVEGRQRDLGSGGVAQAPLACDGDARGDQRVHVAVDGALGDAEPAR
jgi:hypothetical protein